MRTMELPTTVLVGLSRSTYSLYSWVFVRALNEYEWSINLKLKQTVLFLLLLMMLLLFVVVVATAIAVVAVVVIQFLELV